ncbi:MAG: RNA-directed DNA polymerase [Candidatus Heteroscillospira sp.]
MTSEERREARYQRRKAKRDAACKMRSQKCGDFEEVFSFRHLYLAGKKCCKGVYWKNSTQRYIGNIIPNTAKTLRELENGTFKHRGFHEFDIMERGKKRHIRSVHISERAVQKCLCDYCIVPIYSAAFIYDNSASLKRRGMDFALRRMVCQLQKHYRKYGLSGGILVYDFSSFFDSAPHEPLFRKADRRLHDPKLREIANSFITDFGAIGLGLGSQVSQTNALLLPSPLDHYFKEVLRIKGYGRYMDDGYAISEDIDYLYLCRDCLELVCKEIGLTLNRKKTRVIPLENFFRFLKTKFIITPKGKIVLKMNRDSTVIVRRKLRSFKQWYDEGWFTLADVRSAYDSYHGHMKRGNSFRVRQSTDRYFKSVFGFYPNKKGWSNHV